MGDIIITNYTPHVTHLASMSSFGNNINKQKYGYIKLLLSKSIGNF